MKTVVLHPSNKREFTFLVTLLEKLKIPFDILDEKPKETKVEDPLKQLFGIWESEETGDELIEQIYSARMDSPREVGL